MFFRKSTKLVRMPNLTDYNLVCKHLVLFYKEEIQMHKEKLENEIKKQIQLIEQLNRTLREEKQKLSNLLKEQKPGVAGSSKSKI